MSKTTAIVVAAGSGTRMGANVKKQFMEINGSPVIIHTLRKFEACKTIDNIVVVTAQADIMFMGNIVKTYGLNKVTDIVAGGSTRAQSVKNGLTCASDSDYVAIHDGARPCVSISDIEKTIEMAKKHGGAILGERVTDTIKKVDDNGCIVKTVDRAPLWRAQTPQCFETKLIADAYKNADCETVTDDAQVAELSGHKVFVVEASCLNIKITTKNDLVIAQQHLIW